MRIVRWICGHTKKNEIRDDHVREQVRVASIIGKKVENRLKWFEHVQIRPIDAPVKRIGPNNLESN